MHQLNQRHQLFINGGIWAIFGQQQQQRLTTGKQAHCLTLREQCIPVGIVVESKSMVFVESLRCCNLTDGVLAFLQQQRIVSE